MTDEELIKSLVTLLCVRLADDAGQTDMSEKECEEWNYACQVAVLMGAKRVGMMVERMQ